MQKIQANTLGNRIKNSNADTIVIIDSVVYTCLGKGKWENSNSDETTLEFNLNKFVNWCLFDFF